MTSGQTDWYADELENRRKRAAWEEQKKAEAEERDRKQKQSELESYLQRRAREWTDTTGSTDGLGEQLPRWRQQYIDAKVAEQEAERQARLAEAENQPHYNPHI